MTVIVIGDSHIVPLKIQIDRLAMVDNTLHDKISFVPAHWLREGKNLCGENGVITLLKSTKGKTRAHYAAANLAPESTDKAPERLQLSIIDSKIFLVGLGLGGDGLLRAFSKSGTLNEPKASCLPIIPPFDNHACLANTNPFYSRELMMEVLKGYLIKTPAYRYYSAFSRALENYSFCLKVCSVPVISKNAVVHFTGLSEQHLSCYSRVFDIWCQTIFSCISEPDLLQSRDLLDLSHFESNHFLKSEHRFDVKPYGVHASPHTFLPLAKIIAAASI